MRRSVPLAALVLFAVAVLAGKPASAAPITLIDTGPASGTDFAAVLGAPGNQWLAAEFIVTDNWLVTEVQGWIAPLVTGNVRFRLYADGGDVPGSALFEQLLSIAGPGPTGWYGPSGLSWLIGPGSYWLAFESPDTFSGSMPRPSANPLANEAFLNVEVPTYTGVDVIALGVRVFAEARPDPDPQAVPDESSAVALFAAVLLAGGVHFVRRRRPVVA